MKQQLNPTMASSGPRTALSRQHELDELANALLPSVPTAPLNLSAGHVLRFMERRDTATCSSCCPCFEVLTVTSQHLAVHGNIMKQGCCLFMGVVMHHFCETD